MKYVTVIVGIIVAVIIGMIGDYFYEIDTRRTRFVSRCEAKGGHVTEVKSSTDAVYDCTFKERP